MYIRKKSIKKIYFKMCALFIQRNLEGKKKKKEKKDSDSHMSDSISYQRSVSFSLSLQPGRCCSRFRGDGKTQNILQNGEKVSFNLWP